MSEPNKMYKDSVFRMLFNNKANLLELYNALNGSHYTNEDDLTINTLENAIYMSVKNDISFVLHSDLYLFEHQSTINKNMPLRDLFYISDLMSELTANMDIYGTKLLKIHMPCFIVFYNGTDEYPESAILKLSDMYEKKSDNPALELIVSVFNINPGYNKALKEASHTLREYTEFVETVRRHTHRGKLTEKDMTDAVNECIENNILRDFLIANKARAIKMTIYEFDAELHEKNLFEEGKEEGRQEGREEERRNTLLEKQRADAAEAKICELEAIIAGLKKNKIVK